MNTGWILTKHRIIEKVYALFGQTAEILQQRVAAQTALPEAARSSTPKISRGENYRQLPWVMLDYPRVFSKTDTLAIRTFFWWGQGFSVSLQVSGCWQPALEAALREQGNALAEKGYWICVHHEPWEHAFEPGNLIPLGDWMAGQEKREEMNFIRLARPWPLSGWDAAQDFILQTAQDLLDLLKNNQAPSR